MRLTRTVFVALTCLSLATPAAAQRRTTPSPATPAEAAPAGAVTMSAEETRRALEEILKQYPPALPRILRLDPSLLGNPGYLQPYPAFTTFLAQHPRSATIRDTSWPSTTAASRASVKRRRSAP